MIILSVTSKKHYEPNQPADEPRPNPHHLLPGQHIFSEKQTQNIKSDGKLSSLVDYQETKKDRENEERSYKEAFDYFDWNKSGTIPTRFENINATQNDTLLLIACTFKTTSGFLPQ